MESEKDFFNPIKLKSISEMEKERRATMRKIKKQQKEKEKEQKKQLHKQADEKKKK